MKTKLIQSLLPLIIRLAILSGIYYFLSFPLSAYLLEQEYHLEIGEFTIFFLINLLFVLPFLIFVDLKTLINDLITFCIKLCRFIDTLNRWVGNGVAWVTFLVVIVVFVDVVMRYLFKISFVFTQELEWHLFAFIFLIGAGYALLKDAHVRVDIFYQRFGPKTQAWINFIGVIFFLIPGCYMIIATSLNFVQRSYAVMECSPDPGGIPCRFILWSCIPAGFVLVLLQGISLGIKSFFTIIGKETLEHKSGVQK